MPPQNNPEPDVSDSKIVHAMTPAWFQSTIKYIKNCSIERVKTIHVVAEAALNRLKIDPDPDVSVPTAPKTGSDHFDVGSLKTWAGGIVESDSRSIQQLLAIEATAKERI